MKKLRILCVFFILLSVAANASAADEEMVLVQRKDASEPLNLNSAPRPSAQMTNDASGTSSLIRMSGLFLIVLGCCVGGVVLYFRRRSATSALTKQSPRLSIQERLTFGPNREFILLKACDRVLVLSSQNGQMVLLTDMASEEPLPSAPVNVPTSEADPLTYESVLTRATRRLDKTRPAPSTASQTQTQSWPELAELNGVMR